MVFSRVSLSLKKTVHRLGWPLSLVLGALLGAALGGAVGLVTTAFAVGGGNNAPKPRASTPVISPKSAGLAAAYLAGRHAESVADGNTAVNFYNRAMELDPDNFSLLQGTYFLATQAGDFAAAVPAARKAYEVSPNKGMSAVVIAVDHVKKREYDKAILFLEKSPGQNMNSFALPLLRAWANAPSQPAEIALQELASLRSFQDTADVVNATSALLNEFYGRKEDALANYDALASNIENKRFSILRLVAEGYHRLGKNDQVKDVFARYAKTHQASPALDSYVTTVTQAERHKLTVSEGMAEALFAGAELLLMNEPNELRAQVSTAYAQLALYLNPDMSIARRFIGSTLAARGRYAESNAVLTSLKKSAPGYLEVQMQMADNMLRLNRPDDALSILQALLRERPTWSDAHVAVGDIQRQQKKFSQAIEAYDNALKYAPAERAENWVIFYTRGIALERSKSWDAAEKDFKKALELRPDEPSVLNYLGYSYLDRGVKLAEARTLIESAYKQRPNDGYIIDSFGWVQFKSGEYEKAVQSLEKAVEATPSDGTINEHLGDAYWKVGRRNEARFQWQRALGLEIEEEQRSAIQAKLERGLPPE